MNKRQIFFILAIFIVNLFYFSDLVFSEIMMEINYFANVIENEIENSKVVYFGQFKNIRVLIIVAIVYIVGYVIGKYKENKSNNKNNLLS